MENFDFELLSSDLAEDVEIAKKLINARIKSVKRKKNISINNIVWDALLVIWGLTNILIQASDITIQNIWGLATLFAGKMFFVSLADFKSNQLEIKEIIEKRDAILSKRK